MEQKNTDILQIDEIEVNLDRVEVNPRIEYTIDHPLLEGREQADQHPISAVTGLSEALDSLQPAGDYVLRSGLQTELEGVLRKAKEEGLFDGEDGSSPVVAVKEIEGGHRITVTDAGGQKSFDVMDGIGADGTVAHDSLSNREMPGQHPMEAITGLARELNSTGIIVEAGGESVFLSDASDARLRMLKVFGKSVQNGTPAPEAPVDIVSAEGSALMITNENLICGSAESGYISSVDGSVTASPMGYVSYYIPTGADRLYVAIPDYDSSAGGSYVYRVAFYDEKKAWISTQSLKDTAVVLSVPQNAHYFRCSWLKDARVSVCRQEQNGYIEPDGQTMIIGRSLHGVPVSSGGNYTDGSGRQWICDELDFDRGVYVQRLFAERLRADSGGGVNEGQIFFGVFKNSMASIASGEVLCTHLPKGSPINASSANIGIELYSADQIRFRISTEHKSMADISAWLQENEAYVVYPLAVPVETALSGEELAACKALHTVCPVTVMGNDCRAGLQVRYAADAKRYIDSKFDAVNSAILSLGGNV